MSYDNTVPESIQEREPSQAATLALSRRTLLGTSAVAGAVLLVGGKSAHADILRSLRGFIHLDPLVVNFAWEMEELESDFFSRATSSRAYRMLPGRSQNVFNQIAMDDKEHFEAIGFLREKNGNKGATHFESSNASSTRLPRTFRYPSNAFSSTDGLLNTAIHIKKTCLFAYHGAVDLVDKDTLMLAAAIAGVEGRHLAILGEIAGIDPVPDSFENAISSQKAGAELGRYGFAGGSSGGSNVIR